MPRLTMDELEGWISEFRAGSSHLLSSPQAVDMSWDQATIDTALIVMHLETSGTEVYLQREIGGSPEWTVTFERRENDARVSAEQVLTLAAEVSAIGHLCSYLTLKTSEHLQRHAAAQ
ncbi:MULTISPECIES: hypothetical protein [unclassified Curtobacterium]|uniref:hypothetical protein n=1 Tax=unclassified Curtobacterium TaxID=257496 RepID=UPI000DA7E065|nr:MULTISPECIES: hypothetical protein [unclassified Curtobacterium]PZM39787.1 hypothetical protein DEI90_02880 [Curtobacterium sp. MCBD17_031]